MPPRAGRRSKRITLVRTVVSFVHIGALVGGGGCAIAAGRRAERAARARRAPRRRRGAPVGDASSRPPRAGAHRGQRIPAAGRDIDAMVHATTFWTKLGLVVLLIGNGVFLLRAEQRALL